MFLVTSILVSVFFFWLIPEMGIVLNMYICDGFFLFQFFMWGCDHFGYDFLFQSFGFWLHFLCFSFGLDCIFLI